MGNIVHADNSEFFRKMMRTFLVELGHETEGFARGEDALDVVMSGQVDYVITGLQLADMHGEEFIKQLFVSTQVPIIVVTATATENEAQTRRLDDLGVKAIIRKTSSWKDDLGGHLADIGKE